ncbi:MAG TPA: DUF2889 domain-containing protein [Spirochaetota bacterium]|nr:DUF2889 domain-containing protein [Spirochaetota bacterium]
MSALMQKAGNRIHSRDIIMSTWAAGDNQIIIEGELMEKRLNDYYLLSGEKRPAGVLHNMILRLLLEGPELVIRELEVEMPGIPREECGELLRSLDPVIGLSISSGFTQRVKSLVGGVNGCHHLLTLLLAMAPAAVQGYWTHRASRPIPTDREARAKHAKYLPINSCRVWREDGPLVRKIREELHTR